MCRLLLIYLIIQCVFGWLVYLESDLKQRDFRQRLVADHFFLPDQGSRAVTRTDPELGSGMLSFGLLECDLISSEYDLIFFQYLSR